MIIISIEVRVEVLPSLALVLAAAFWTSGIAARGAAVDSMRQRPKVDQARRRATTVISPIGKRTAWWRNHRLRANLFAMPASGCRY